MKSLIVLNPQTGGRIDFRVYESLCDLEPAIMTARLRGKPLGPQIPASEVQVLALSPSYRVSGQPLGLGLIR